MDLTLIIISVIIIILLILIIVFINNYNKYQFAIIKINEAENNIDILLDKKVDYISRFIPIIKENTKEKCKELEKVNMLKSQDYNNFELNKELGKYEKELHEIIDIEEKLTKVETFNRLYENYEDNEDELAASKEYYNDTVSDFNKLIHCFPSNIVGLILKYKDKAFYIDEKEEMFEILKEK